MTYHEAVLVVRLISFGVWFGCCIAALIHTVTNDNDNANRAMTPAIVGIVTWTSSFFVG